MAQQQQQQFMMVEFIEKVKRKNAGRENPYQYDDTTPITSNRGNKLNRNAKFVRQGRLNNTPLFKTKIEHAGYSRNIISVNPPFYTPEGDVIEDDSEIDEDDEPLEENIYKDIKLEELLAPLTSAAELPAHPSLSQPYKDRGLPEMIRKAEEQLHEEQRILWKMKALFTSFRGDAVWAPVGMFHSEVDDMILGTHRMSDSSATFSGDPHVVIPTAGSADLETETRLVGQHLAEDEQMADDITVEGSLVGSVTNGTGDVPVEAESTVNQDTTEQPAEPATNGDVPPIDPPIQPTTNGNSIPIQDTTMMEPNIEDAEDNNSSAPSHRMTTRRQTRQPSRSRSPSPNPSLTSSAQPPIDPFYTFPTSAIPDAQSGVPSNMADGTRFALTSYISKQEEIVRSFRDLHEGLLKAYKMRKDVFDWCKAEGHEGEMSDHEDWVDLEEWGIEKRQFKKGMLEEEADEEEERRGKRVRRVGRGTVKD
ncbi:hypothetical protein EJ08DRAFT_735572 [Tothia fuscella]|uniref:Transcriptional regulatory protein RXT2 N-terminal domain-containing protein n=1 Tax=Tothia fuscella TaxID=1048955 RepID=A0A9P4NN86_9PEZI|nr:hypothetical protein EJ08DRAFT_735572 [Tothia fuscella]